MDISTNTVDVESNWCRCDSAVEFVHIKTLATAGSPETELMCDEFCPADNWLCYGSNSAETQVLCSDTDLTSYANISRCTQLPALTADRHCAFYGREIQLTQPTTFAFHEISACAKCDSEYYLHTDGSCKPKADWCTEADVNDAATLTTTGLYKYLDINTSLGQLYR